MSGDRPVKLLRVSEAAARLEVAPRTIRRWIADGKIGYVRLHSGHYRIPLEETQLALGPGALQPYDD